MKTILFAWELGRGMGHVASLSRLAARFKPHDVRMVAVVKDLASARILESSGLKILQAPSWPQDRYTPAERAAASSATMNDILAWAGLANEQAVRALLGEWDRILETVKPDLVVAEFSPIASLAARGRFPLLIVGNGYTLPPSEMKRFPPLHRNAPPRSNEEETLATVNRVLRSTGRSPLEQLPQLFAADARLVETFALLDPYNLQRLEPADGPVFEGPPIARRQDAQDIFVYLSRGVGFHAGIVEALVPFASRLCIHAPELTSEQSTDLVHRGARVHANPLPVRETLFSSRLVIHLGGSGLAAEAIAAGVPQFILPTHIEQQLNGAALENAGIGQRFVNLGPESRVSSDMIEAALADDAMAERAMLVGERHRDMLQTLNPLLAFETAALRLLNA